MNTANPPLHVALVDDDTDVRVGLRTLLRSYGYRVSVHESAQQLLSTGFADVDCVVSDVQMPGMDGLELLARLRSAPDGPPCILMTAFPETHIRVRAMRTGASCFLTKPVDAEELAACIAKASSPS